VEGVDGVLKVEETRGFAYLQRAVTANNDFAKYGLAKCYRDGKGTPVNAEEAKRLMSEAALAEVPPVMAEYGQLLVANATGPEANQDIRRGCDLISTAAEKYNSPIAWRAILEYHNKWNVLEFQMRHA